MYITDLVGRSAFLYVCFGKVKRNARPDQLITFTRRLREGLPINYPELPSAALNQTCMFQSLVEQARVLDGSARGGVLTPATGLGNVLVERLRQAGMVIEPK
jgi:hypothetical protein